MPFANVSRTTTFTLVVTDEDGRGLPQRITQSHGHSTSTAAITLFEASDPDPKTSDNASHP